MTPINFLIAVFLIIGFSVGLLYGLYRVAVRFMTQKSVKKLVKRIKDKKDDQYDVQIRETIYSRKRIKIIDNRKEVVIYDIRKMSTGLSDFYSQERGITELSQVDMHYIYINLKGLVKKRLKQKEAERRKKESEKLERYINDEQEEK